jgi:hypothetical protein
MARGIEHDAAPSKTRRVVDAQRGHVDARGFRRILREQLPERDAAVEQAVRAARADADARGVDGEFVGFVGRRRQRTIEHELDRAR